MPLNQDPKNYVQLSYKDKKGKDKTMYYYIPEGVFCYKKGKEYKKYKE